LVASQAVRPLPNASAIPYWFLCCMHLCNAIMIGKSLQALTVLFGRLRLYLQIEMLIA
jgi:hypothetical protein